MEWFTATANPALLVFFTIVIVNAVRRFVRDRIERGGFPLPPGPTALPLLGNVLSVNAKEPWRTYTDWRAKYGDIVYSRLVDTDVIVLNSYSVVMDLVAKRSHIYSDRPFIATVKPFGCDCNFGFTPYGEHWKLCRRIFHQTFRPEASVNFRPMQLRRARQMIANIMEEPNAYAIHYSTFSAAVAMSSVYDYEPRPRKDPIVSLIDSFLNASFPAMTPEKAVLLKAFPFLLHLPDWFPGSSIKLQARKASALRDKMVEMPYQYVQKRMESKDHVNDVMVFDHIARMEQLEGTQRAEYEIAVKHASISAFMGSTETTSSTILTFTLAMVQNPHVWKRAQAEIDSVTGGDRLPEFEDRESLPFVEAIVRETFRWKPVGPLGVVHATTSSDIYNDFYIPKGATVITNIWAMAYDEVRYPNPETFRPERFLDAQGRLIDDDPADFVFGFGRRACPGRHTGDASVWSAIVMMLATLEFNAAKDEEGNDVVFEAAFTSGLTLRPIPFPCQLTPRPRMARDVLKRMLAQ